MVSVVPAVLAVAVFGGIATAPAAFATPHVNEGVCPVYDETSYKKEFTDGHLSFEYTAPEGYVVVGWCSKAGSFEQGDGPYEVTGLNTATVVITHPSGKDLSHIVVNYELISVVLPPVDEEPPTDEEPVDPPLVNWIVTMPELPTVCKGVPNIPASTEQVSYASYGEYIAIYPQNGWTFVQDLTEPESDAIGAPHKNYIELHISELEEVCPADVPVDEKPDVQEPPAVVTPPNDQTPPPADDTTTVVPDPVVASPVTNDHRAVDTPVTPVEPVSDIPLAPAMLANVGGGSENAAQLQTAESSTTQLANTGFDPIAFLTWSALAIAAGYALIRKVRRYQNG